MDNYKGFDLEKNKGLFPKLQEESIKEDLEHIPDSYIHFTNNDVSNYCLNEIKSGIKANVSPRVLTNWIKEEVIKVDASDKGKIKRFDRVENIWLEIVVFLRNIGVPLKALKEIRKQLFSYEVNDFCLLKFKVLNNILINPEYLTIDENHTVGFYSYKDYGDITSRGGLLPHINLKLTDYIKLEFPNNNFHTDFKIKDVEQCEKKIALQYFLKTNDFEEINVTLSNNKNKTILNSFELKRDKTLLNSVQKWDFKIIDIKINDLADFVIKN